MLARAFAAVALLWATGGALAQAPTMPTEFPAGAQPLEAEALLQRLSGKVFSAKPVSGPAWRLQYQAGGHFYINAGSFSDSGKWRVEGSRLCSEPQKSRAACNEVRLSGDALYLKRDSGEIIRLEPN